MDKKEELAAAVVARAKEIDGKKRISCSECFALAGQFGVEIGEIGRICNEAEIRICKCQLGCFG